MGRVESSGLSLREVHRFQYPPTRSGGHLRWPSRAICDGLEAGIRAGIDAAKESGDGLASVGVDSWGVDYGLVGGDRRLVEEPIAYRDERTAGEMERTFASVPRAEIFARTGIQFLVFNTLYQLRAHLREGLPAEARRLLMIPDLCHSHLCGSITGEYTNASTTQLLDPRTRRWDLDLISRLGLPPSLFPPLVEPGTEIGRLRTELGDGSRLRVIAPATHDTGSAVAGIPLRPGWAYISSGTWSLVGTERNAPLINDAVAAANFTNEGGVAGTVRFLRNVMGLWILESVRREWSALGHPQDYEQLLAAVAAVDGFCGFVYPDDPSFLNPPSMIDAINAQLDKTGQGRPADPVRLAKVVLDSLALRYASVLDAIEALTSDRIAGVHVVGGGSQNAYLNQATADACTRPVLAGPVEATAIGNLLVQALATNRIASVADGRDAVARGSSLREFEPRQPQRWEDARARYRDLEAAAV